MMNSWSRHKLLFENHCVCTKIIFSQLLTIFYKDEILNQTTCVLYYLLL